MSEIDQLRKENEDLRRKYNSSIQYIRAKTDQLLNVMGTSALRPEELDDATLIETDPIGIVSNSFVHVLKHLKKINAKLKFASDEIKAIFDSVGMGILVIDNDMRVVSYNRMLKKLFFPDKESITGRRCYELICRKGDHINNCPFKEIFKTGADVHQRQWELPTRHFDVVGTPLKDDNNNVLNVVLVYLEITERIAAEQALRRSEEKYRDLFENANDLIQSVGPDGSILYVNKAWRETLGYSEDDVPQLSIFDVIHPDCIDCGPDFKEVVCGDRAGRIETTFITKTRDKIIVEGNISTITDAGKFAGTRGIFRDITSRKLAEETLAAERERLAITLRSIGDAVIVTDTSGRITLINRIAEEFTGYTGGEAVGMPLSKVFMIINENTRQPCESPVEKVLQTGLIVELANHTVLVRKDGSEIIIADSAAPIRDVGSNIIGVVLVFRDITSRSRIEAEMQKMQKLESLGLLAGGLAHDFNNLLTGIMGNISIVKTNLDHSLKEYALLSAAETAAERATDLTQQLLTFAKGGTPIKKVLPIADLVRKSVDFALSGSNVSSNYSIPDDLWNTEADEGQIAQVFNNLSINAIHAMPGGGMVNVRMENIALAPNIVPTLPAHDYIKIVFSDNGAGISEKHLPKIFDPYFTTKTQGSGLGLATVFSILKKHDGYISVESGVGTGTRFSIYLPATRDTSDYGASPGDALTVGYGNVLVMDDEALVRDIAGEMLTMLGYKVQFALDGEEAFAIYKKSIQEKNPFRLLIMDLTIPGGIGGKEAVRKILEIDPEAKAIASSGYSTDPIMSEYKKYGFSGVMIKPYKIEQMSETISRVLSL